MQIVKCRKKYSAERARHEGWPGPGAGPSPELKRLHGGSNGAERLQWGYCLIQNNLITTGLQSEAKSLYSPFQAVETRSFGVMTGVRSG
ncbi:MAG: hypothetical protein GX989_06195 [Firmicutes bacterium]|nr:hypothetical protein [Bacillota bacterium]